MSGSYLSCHPPSRPPPQPNHLNSIFLKYFHNNTPRAQNMLHAARALDTWRAKIQKYLQWLKTKCKYFQSPYQNVIREMFYNSIPVSFINCHWKNAFDQRWQRDWKWTDCGFILIWYVIQQFGLSLWRKWLKRFLLSKLL